jgi:hypothetical protein
MNTDQTAGSAVSGTTPWWRLVAGSVLWPEETARARHSFFLIAAAVMVAASLFAQVIQVSRTDWEKTIRLQLRTSGYVLPEADIKYSAEMARRLSVVTAFAGVVQQAVTFLAWAAGAWLLLRLMKSRIVFGHMLRILLVACLPAALLYYGATAAAILQSGQYDPTSAQSVFPSNAATWFGVERHTLASTFLGYVDVFLIWVVAVSIVLLHRIASVPPVKAAVAMVLPVVAAASCGALFSLWPRH